MKKNQSKHVVIPSSLHGEISRECREKRPRRMIGDRVEELIVLGRHFEKNFPDEVSLVIITNH